MPKGWSASSLVPGLGGLTAGSNIVSRGTLSGGAAPMNTIDSTMPGGTGIPPFVTGALNPFLNAVLGQQAQARQATAARPAAPMVNPADIIRAQTQQAQQTAAERAAASTQWNLDKLRGQLGAIPTGFGGMAMGGLGPQRAELQQRIFGLEGTLGRQQAAAFGQPISPMGWSNTFAIPTY